MMTVIFFTLLIFSVARDSVSCTNLKTPTKVTVVLGESLTLNCTYNCSTGFVRGCWTKGSDNSGCRGKLTMSNFCTVSLHLLNVSTEDLNRSFTCYTQNTDDPKLAQKTEKIVLLQLKAQTSAPSWTVTPMTETTNASLPAKPNNPSGGEFTGIKILATVTVTVAMVLAVLAAYLCLSRSKQGWNGKGELIVSRSSSLLPSPPPPVKGSLPTQNERVTLRIPTPDNQSDTEVPYADIMITVRGVSTPELTQVGYVTSGDQKEWWGDDLRSHLQAYRSADRLHIPGVREVSRKMSTNSEYAVITYS